MLFYIPREFLFTVKNIKSLTILYFHFVNKTTKVNNEANEATQKNFTKNCILLDKKLRNRRRQVYNPQLVSLLTLSASKLLYLQVDGSGHASP